MTEADYYLIGNELLESMRDNALIVNTARGAIINENELIEVVKTGRIRAVLDVYEEESLTNTSELRGLSNVILMPHVGGPTIDMREVVTLELIENLKRIKNGEDFFKNEISFEQGRRMSDDKKFVGTNNLK